MNDHQISLTPDSFLNALGLQELEGRLHGAEQRDALFRLTLEFLQDKALLEPVTNYNAMGELSLKVPGTAIIVRLGSPGKQELAAVLGLACYMFGSGMLDAKSITLVGVMAVLSRVRSLRAEFGERSIIDALGEVDRKTKENVTVALYGKPCRYPRANCRYLASDGRHCAIETSQVSATIDDLVHRNILRSRSAVEPIEYGLVI